MKKLIFLATIIMVSTYSFADIQSSELSNPQHLQALSKAWKSQQNTQPQSISKDITIVYGGADIAHKQMLTSHQFIV